MIGTIIKRRERHIYVAIWFYIATFVTVAVLHIFNSFEIPVSFLKSLFCLRRSSRCLSTMVVRTQCCGIFLNHTIFRNDVLLCSKSSQSSCIFLQIINHSLLVFNFIYIWAGPHHLLYSALPDWAQNLGVVFSIMLIAPSWGGMINGLLTLRGVWDKVRTDSVLKFFVVAITGYGMATFEGPMLSLKNVNAIAHLHRLDYCSRSRWCIGLERISIIRYDLLVDSKNDKI